MERTDRLQGGVLPLVACCELRTLLMPLLGVLGGACFAALIASFLALVLVAAGDTLGGAALRGVSLVALVFAVLSFTGLGVALALIEIGRGEDPRRTKPALQTVAVKEDEFSN